MTLTSALEKITSRVFAAKTVDEAKSICLEFLNNSKIKESDRFKMINEISEMRYLSNVQRYIANALLKYEGLGTTIN